MQPELVTLIPEQYFLPLQEERGDLAREISRARLWTGC
jgi:hypothetical protein